MLIADAEPRASRRARRPASAPADEPKPLRAELFSVGQLERHARTLAGWHELAPTRSHGRTPLLARLASSEALFRDAYRLLTEAVERGRQITPAAEWFIDNHHVIEDQIKTAQRHLPRSYHRELPQLSNASAPGTPRVYELAIELISHTHGRVDRVGLEAFTSAYQAVQPLRLGELWAIPIMLRLALLENLRRVVGSVTLERRERERAAYWVAEMAAVATNDPARLVLVLADLVEEAPTLSPTFVAELASRLQAQGPSLALAMSWLEQRLAEQSQTVDHVFHLASQSQAADQVSVSNSIGSLRFLGATDWRVFVESASVVERALREDPTGDYAAMDFGTRDRYRHVVEAVAKRSPSSEEDVARAAIDLARASGQHVGVFVVSDGRRALERAVAMRSTLGVSARRVVRKARAALYVGALVALTALVTVGLAVAAPAAPSGWALLPWWGTLTLCASMLSVAVVHTAATLLVGPRLLPRLDFSTGIPPEHQTVVAVPVMLTDPAEIDELVESLEVRFLANRDDNLTFALLSDFRDAPTETVASDEALLDHARAAIMALNAKYTAPPGAGARANNGHPRAPFFLFHRARIWSPSEGVWMGWERKRGKLEDFNATLRGVPGRFASVVGPVGQLQRARYVIALDADTDLPRDAARLLAGTLGHPLNRPVFDATRGRITRGYGVLQPRVGVTMESTGHTRFARLFAGEPGIDPYTRATSDVYQDVFDEGSFVGKGIYDVDALRRAVAGRLPESRVLSHDLLEGGYARAGLVSDVELVETHPSVYAAEVSRRTRWMRGDWQIASWLLPRVPGVASRGVRNPLSWLSRWKIFDNLRRSVLPVALLALLLWGWLLPGAAAFATVAAASLLLLPGLFVASTALVRRPADHRRAPHLREVARRFGRELGRQAFTLATLPYDAFLAVDAIARTLVRVAVTRRRLLVWRTASDAQRGARVGLLGSYLSMWPAPALSALATAALALLDPTALAWASPVLALWLAAPALAWWLSRPLVPARARLTPDDRAFLRTVAHRTWRYFETFVGAEDHHLPPDNYQEDPSVGPAHRTSPTNIGLALTANLAAFDLGYLTTTELLTRTTRTLDTMDRLSRYCGHFYNWYDTRTLEPLHPMYVSTVDSGNLAGHLLALAGGLEELADRPVLGPQILSGLADILAQAPSNGGRATPAMHRVVARSRAELERARESSAPSVHQQALARLGADARELVAAARGDHPITRVVARPRDLARLGITGGAAKAASALEIVPVRLAWALSFEAACRAATAEFAHLAPWLDHLRPGEAPPRHLDVPLSLTEIAQLAPTGPRDGPRPPTVPPWPADAARGAGGVPTAVARAAGRASTRLRELRALAARCRGFADFDCGLLFDRARGLFTIGYNVEDQRCDDSYYDLLASEARLASFIAIAQGSVPQEHWFSLGRQLTLTGGRPALLSWSGSMFEYLMPLLVMPTYQHTLLDQTYRAVVARQIAYGREMDVPWGVSESGYHKFDASQNYQYRAFGVPGLGFKRGLADDRVITPYASALALMVAPEAATANLRVLADDGMLGAYGFYEATDYTPSRLPPGAREATVRSYMAHHQGMVLLSLVYLLRDQPMQRRFEADPAMRATNLLLQERVPRTTAIYPHPPALSPATHDDVASGAEHRLRVYTSAATAAPEVHLLSNGSYHVVVTHAGGGYSRWRDLAVTRWREDATRDCWGAFGYLRDVTSGDFWSVAHQPTLCPATRYEAIFSQGRAEFRRLDGDIYTHVEISVSPEDDVELRRVSLSNRGTTRRTLELTSYAEVVLASAASDVAHPAFSNLFVRTEIVPDQQAIVVTRRPRSDEERPPWMIHQMTVHGTTQGATSYETARGAFIGRGRTVADPIAMYRDALSDTDGAVLDPIVAIRSVVVLEAQETAHFHVVSGVHETRAGAMALLEKFRDRHAADRVLELSWTHAQLVQRRLAASDLDIQVFERLASRVLYNNPAMRAPPSVIARNRGGQSGLWAYGISGDLPIVLLRIADFERLGLVSDLVKAHAYWHHKGLRAELVIWIEDPSGYRQTLMDEIVAVVGAVSDASWLDKPGGIFVRRGEQIAEEDKILMQTLARVIVSDTAGPLAEQMEARPRPRMPEWREPEDVRAGASRQVAPGEAEAIERPDLHAFNGLGGFTADGREYVIITTRDRRTAAPWVNVLANPWFGSVVSESGGAYTWCENAHSHRLTPWSNDPVSDTSGEAFYVRDEDGGRFWSPSPLPAGADVPYTSRHGFGYSIFEADAHGVATKMTTYVAADAPVKFVVLRLRNRSGRARRLTVTAYFELVLGEHRAGNVPHVVTELDSRSAALMARNPYSADFGARVAFLDCSEEQRTVSGDRAELIGRNGTLARPVAMRRTRLSGRVGAGLDPCLAMQVTIDLVDGQEREVAFTLGSGRDLDDARGLVARFRGTGPAHTALEGVWERWKRTLGAVTVATPDPALNFLANGWLLYQVLSARMWGRSGFYQSGGAFGFRDQLQDAMALVHSEPALLREQLLRAASRQFREGDVQHWWHPPQGRGVRTTISDDYLWLPYALCRYVGALGDTGVMDERVPYLEGRPVNRNEESYYDLPVISEEVGTLYEHAARAVQHGLRFGVHGLPLMGGGDWNDGMNLVGAEGRGESVWLGFFLYAVLLDFAELARGRGDEAFAGTCVAEAARLRDNLEAHGWDGDWYRRAYFDSGAPLGSASSVECQIDAIPQSWAVLSGAGDPARAARALAAVDERLVRPDLGLITLFDPPFQGLDAASADAPGGPGDNPGYVQGYVPGVRENGGQYTHAAIWTVMAFAAAGEVERAWELFGMINPVRHGDSPEAIARYKVEPYVIAADVYVNPQHAGRGGWTWYTGSASWMYRLIVESLLGLHLEVDRLRFAPRLPAAWPGFEARYRHRRTLYHIHVTNLGAGGGEVRRVVCDGVEQPGASIQLRDDGGEHHVEVEVGG